MPRSIFANISFKLSLPAVLVLISVSIANSVSGSVLLLEQTRSQVQLACIELNNNQFELSFIHSVSLTQVFDRYQLLESKLVVGDKNNSPRLQILQTQERFSAHGQGLPSLVDEPDALAFKHENGQFILDLHRSIKYLIVRTDERFKNRLYTGNKEINLNQWPDTGILVTPLSQCP
jgi:hypothetical protein